MKGKQEITIQHPEAWELLVSLQGKRVRYILFTPAVANSLYIDEVECAEDSLQGLEDAVLNTPVLLDDYKRVRIVVYPQHFVLFPQDVSDEDCTALLHEAFPADDGDAAVSLMPKNGVKVAYLLPCGIQAFVGRTFNYPVVVPHLVPLGEHFKSLVRSDDRKRLLLHLADNRTDLAVYEGDKLMCLNSYPFINGADVTYFTLGAWRSQSLDQLKDELQIMGDNELQSKILPTLREYVKNVMPAVYPAAAMRLGRNAMQAPLELILLALCE